MSWQTVFRILWPGVPLRRNADAPLWKALWTNAGLSWIETIITLVPSNSVVIERTRATASMSESPASTISTSGLFLRNSGKTPLPAEENPTTEIFSSRSHKKRKASRKRRLLSIMNTRAFFFFTFSHHIKNRTLLVSQTSIHSPESGYPQSQCFLPHRETTFKRGLVCKLRNGRFFEVF